MNGNQIGATQSLSGLTGSLDNGGAALLGSVLGQTTSRFAGTMGEVRLTTGVPSSDWILTEYRNQSSPSEFVLFGYQEDQSAGGGGGSAVATPSFMQDGATLTMSGATAGATNYYTTSSAVYSARFRR